MNLCVDKAAAGGGGGAASLSLVILLQQSSHALGALHCGRQSELNSRLRLAERATWHGDGRTDH